MAAIVISGLLFGAVFGLWGCGTASLGKTVDRGGLPGPPLNGHRGPHRAVTAAYAG